MSFTEKMHIGIILDGNRTWARGKGLDPLEGHNVGFDLIESTILNAIDLKIDILSLWGLSTENIKNRSQYELKNLYNIFKRFKNLKKFLKTNNVKIQFIGNKNILPFEVYSVLKELVQYTEKNTGIEVNLCLGYGGRDEIISGIKKFIVSGESIESLDEVKFRRYLFSGITKDPDLIIRTGGHSRTSGFLLYAAAYSDFYFLDKNWPDFNKKDLLGAVEYLKSCNKKFGK